MTRRILSIQGGGLRGIIVRDGARNAKTTGRYKLLDAAVASAWRIRSTRPAW